MKKLLSTLFAVLFTATFAYSKLQLNEIHIDMPGSDIDEYFEITGSPGESLDGVWYVVLGDHSGQAPNLPTKGSGTIEFATSLDGLSIPSSGFFLGTEFGFTLNATPTNQFFDLIFENNDSTTHMIVRGYTGPRVEVQAEQEGDLGVTIDLNNDGVVDVDPLPWTEVIDAVAVTEPNGDEPPYGAAFGGTDVPPNGTFTAGHVFRSIVDNSWVIGSFDVTGEFSDDTPGAENPEGDVIPTELIIKDQPQSVTISGGESTQLTVNAEGPGTLVYEWFQGQSGDTSTPVAGLSILGEADITHNVTFYNGDDALGLRKNGVLIDVIGVIGVDPTAGFWGSGDATTGEHTLVRKSSVTQGNADGFVGNETDLTGEWTGFPQDTIDDLGMHTADAAATDLFFSEYIEGSSNNKAFEIYNGTGADVDLSQYVVELYFNGATDPGNPITLSEIQPTLEDGEVLVIANAQAVGPSEDFNTPALSETTSYWVRVSDGSASVDSDTATVTVEGGALDVFGGEPIDGFPDWRASSWYLNYNVEFWPWIFHDEHSWQFVFDGSTTNGIFLFDLGLENWIFLTESTYRWQYLFSDTPGWIFTFDDNTASPYRRFFQRGDDFSIFEVTLGQ